MQASLVTGVRAAARAAARAAPPAAVLIAVLIASLAGMATTGLITPADAADDTVQTPSSGVPDPDARTTFGIGVGALYGGLGFNVGRVNGARFVYGSLGCIDGSTSRARTVDGFGNTQDEGRPGDSNCGIGVGVLTTDWLPGMQQAFGLNVGLTYDTEGTDVVEWHFRPTFNYFFGDAPARGANLGISPVLSFTEDRSDTGLLLNVGYQF